ncbi:MAG: hypothetical protein ACT4P6_17350 [Gemmatimonadaceae bacterium]
MQRVERPSSLGDWSYEVADTKLSRETRGGTILQLSLYSGMLATAQKSPPELFHVVTPDAVQAVRTYRVADYAAYCRLILVVAIRLARSTIRSSIPPRPIAVRLQSATRTFPDGTTRDGRDRP